MAIPQTASNTFPLFLAQGYIDVVFCALTVFQTIIYIDCNTDENQGIAPTLMVAQVALASKYTSDTELITNGISCTKIGGRNQNMNRPEVAGHSMVTGEGQIDIASRVYDTPAAFIIGESWVDPGMYFL